MECTLEIPLLGPMVLRTPYSEGLVGALKRTLPAEMRAFDPDRGAWVIGSCELRPKVEKIVLRYFPALHVFDHGSNEDYVVDRVGRAAQTRLF